MSIAKLSPCVNLFFLSVHRVKPFLVYRILKDAPDDHGVEEKL